jgi:hypothetical protein
MVPYVDPKKNRVAFEEIPYGSFIDYKSNKEYPNPRSQDSSFYWKPLRLFVEKYMDHEESKSEPQNGIGLLNRRHLTTSRVYMHPVGKETNDLDKNQIMGMDPDSYTQYQSMSELITKILNLTEEEAKTRHLSRSWLYETKKLIRDGKPFQLYKNTIKRLLK